MRFPMTPFEAAWRLFAPKSRKRRWWEFWKAEVNPSKPTVNPSKPTVFGCPECLMPIDAHMQRTNIRIEQPPPPLPLSPMEEQAAAILKTQGHDYESPWPTKPYYVLSCGWCGCVINIGSVDEVDARFTIAKKGDADDQTP